MDSSSTPSKIQLPFANAGGKRVIPIASQPAEAASFTDGFPPVTRTPIAAGGIPPNGLDMNGILFDITSIQQWQCAGGLFPYDSALSTQIGGYPKGARLINASANGIWVNDVDNNVTNPDTGGAGWHLEIAGNFQRMISVSSTTTLTTDQSGSFIECSNTGYVVNLPAPTSQNISYSFYNVASSSNVTISTPSGVIVFGGIGSSTYPLLTGASLRVISDGSNWIAINSSGIFSKAPISSHKDASGLITKYGSILVSANNVATPITFAEAFPTVCAMVVISPVDTGTNVYRMSTGTPNVNGVSAYNTHTAAVTGSWIAIGY